MSLLHPSRTTRRILKLASFGLAGLIAGLLTGCTSTTARVLETRVDTDWQTTSTYASAIATLPPHDSAVRSARVHTCFSAPCQPHATPTHPRTSHHSM